MAEQQDGRASGAAVVGLIPDVRRLRAGDVPADTALGLAVAKFLTDPDVQASRFANFVQ